MTRLLRLGWRGWAYALGKASIGGAASTVVSAQFLLPLLDCAPDRGSFVRFVIGLFASSFLTNAAYFLARSPLPDLASADGGQKG